MRGEVVNLKAGKAERPEPVSLKAAMAIFAILSLSGIIMAAIGPIAGDGPDPEPPAEDRLPFLMSSTADLVTVDNETYEDLPVPSAILLLAEGKVKEPQLLQDRLEAMCTFLYPDADAISLRGSIPGGPSVNVVETGTASGEGRMWEQQIPSTRIVLELTVWGVV